MEWNTKIINFVETELQGNVSSFVESPYYKLNNRLRKANLIFAMTADERLESKRMTGLPYFSNRYVHAITENGFQKIQLRNYQEEMLANMADNRFNIMRCSRQIGTSTLLAIFAAHTAMTRGKYVFVSCSNLANAAAFVDKVKTIYMNIPFALKPGVVSWNDKSIKFDNDGHVVGGVLLETELKAKKRPDHLIFSDAQHIKGFDTLYSTLVPLIMESDTTMTITLSGTNGFTSVICNEAKLGTTPFVLSVYPWTVVPGRDELWKEKMITAVGSEKMFEEEFGCSDADGEAVKVSNTVKKRKKVVTLENLVERILLLEEQIRVLKQSI